MSYSDSISINKNFQTSINLELDLGNNKKIDEYIPTSDICDVIKKYIKTALGETKEFSTILVGPYGKGKSFLLLVLLFLLGKNKNTKSWVNLANKIKKIDLELFEMLQEIKQKNLNLVPVIINSNYDDINQSFQLALNDSLKNLKLENLIPNSVFDICISLLNKWEAREDLKENIVKKCIELNNINLEELKTGLQNYSQVAYTQFEKLYNCLNVGLAFNPLINNDVIKTYSNIITSLNENGYSGFFIVFDEFSKFLERNTSNLMRDLKIVQDFAELASRSSTKSQIHFCCVTHKSIGLYKKDKKNGNINDSFKTVEGRFKEIRFNRSLNENYQLISSALIRKDNFFNELSNFVQVNNNFITEMSSLYAFRDKNLQKILFKECFPLNPLTVYSLIHVCEKVAQNERTLFTFLSDTDDDSFNSFIHTQSDGLFNVDKIYDYFNQLFKREDSSEIQNIWYRTESILSKLENSNERKIIKVLAIITIINNYDEFPPISNLISLSLELPLKDVKQSVNSLIEKHYIRENLISHYLSFSLSSSKEIDENVAIIKNTKLKNLKFSEIANELNEKKYILPRQYNEENKITRFYNVIFLTEDEFLKIPSYNYYFEQNYCDGLVINLMHKNIKKDQIIEKIKLVNDSRIIVKRPKEEIDEALFESLRYFACLKEMKKQKGFDEIILGQIDLIIDEVKIDTQSLINNYFEQNYEYYNIYYFNTAPFNQAISEIMRKIYSYKLIFNNELMNKKDITTQYQKAINHVIDWLLEHNKEFEYSETSPEFSVRYAALDSYEKNDSIGLEYINNYKNLISLIKNKLLSLNGEKISVKELLKDFSYAPYGIRDGVIPILFAKSISELSDNAVLFYQQKEIELNSLNIVKSIKNDNYQISFAKGSIEQKEYLNNLLELFDVKKTDNFRTDILNLTKNIKIFFMGMPQIIRICTSKNNFLCIDEKIIEFKNVFLAFDINPYESIFVKTLNIFNTEKYSKVFGFIKDIVEQKDNLLFNYYIYIISSTKEMFGISINSSLKTGFKDFFNKDLNKKNVTGKINKELFDFTNFDISYDDIESINKIAKIITSQYIEDWNCDKSTIIFETLKDFKNSLEVQENNFDPSNIFENMLSNINEIDGMSSLLKNNIESILDEFSGSISDKEKANVLISILKDLL